MTEVSTMAATTLIAGLTIDQERLEEIGRWVAAPPDARLWQPVPAGMELLHTLLGNAALREPDQDAKLEMLQAGASYMIILIEDWLRENRDSLAPDLSQSLTRWSLVLGDMAQDCESAKTDESGA